MVSKRLCHVIFILYNGTNGIETSLSCNLYLYNGTNGIETSLSCNLYTL